MRATPCICQLIAAWHCIMYYCLKMNVIYVCLCCLHVLSFFMPMTFSLIDVMCSYTTGGVEDIHKIILCSLSLSLSLLPFLYLPFSSLRPLSPSLFLSLPPSLPSSLPPSLPPSLLPSLPPSLLPSLPPSLLPSLPSSLPTVIYYDWKLEEAQ